MNNLLTTQVECAVQQAVDRLGVMVQFWRSSDGWAPREASAILKKSQLEWQPKLAEALRIWNRDLNEAELILAWANLGAVVEGVLKLFLCVHYNDYLKDKEPIVRYKKTVEPDSAEFGGLIGFFERRIWSENEPWDEWVKFVQRRRNAIHAFKSREIGTALEFHQAVIKLPDFVERINGQLPYP